MEAERARLRRAFTSSKTKKLLKHLAAFGIVLIFIAILTLCILWYKTIDDRDLDVTDETDYWINTICETTNNGSMTITPRSLICSREECKHLLDNGNITDEEYEDCTPAQDEYDDNPKPFCTGYFAKINVKYYVASLGTNISSAACNSMYCGATKSLPNYNFFESFILGGVYQCYYQEENPYRVSFANFYSIPPFKNDKSEQEQKKKAILIILLFMMMLFLFPLVCACTIILICKIYNKN